MKISEMSFFQGIDSKVIGEIEAECARQDYRSEEIIFDKGDPAEFLYFLETGRIELVFKEKSDTICTIGSPGDVFGWSAIVEDGVYTSSAISRTQTRVMYISRQAIKRIFNTHPEAAVIFYQRIGTVFSKRLTTVIS